MEATKKKIGIFYRYNKYQPISGSIFYALEYYFTLMNTIEKEIQDNLLFGKEQIEIEVTLYWIFPKKIISTKEIQEKFRTRLLRLAAAKYPLTYKIVDSSMVTDYTRSRPHPKIKTSINKILETLNLNQNDKSSLLELNKKLDTYFKNIKIISETDLLKIKVDKSLFMCQNTVHDSILSDLIINKPENFGDKYFICNRDFNSISSNHQSIWKKMIKVPNSKFLYELPRQKIYSEPSSNLEDQSNLVPYSLKLNVDLFWKKEYIKKYKKYLKENKIVLDESKTIMKTGKPVNNLEAYNSFFSWNDNFSYDNFHPYMIWDIIHYYKTGFDENNRSIIESNFYGIPFKIMGNNGPMSKEDQDKYIESLGDSLFDRKENPKKYLLTREDELIKELIKELIQ